MTAPTQPLSIKNIQCFIAFRVFFNARFYYPVFTVLFLDMGLTLEQFTLLNAVWGVTIVLMEVPSGAFADIFGRQKLIVIAACCMVVEMCLMAFIPLGNATIVFWALLINRVISGFAEAMASGADEALAYDSLKEVGLEDKWPAVLERLMRFQSMAFFVAMLLGAIIYDADAVNFALDKLGLGMTVLPEQSLRFPLYLNLVTAFLALFVTLRMRPVAEDPEKRAKEASVSQAFKLTLDVGRWISKTPYVWLLILAALLYDSIIRMFLTLNSEYYRYIEIPEAALGALGSAMSLIGLAIPALAKRFVEQRSELFNFVALGVWILMGLIGLVFLIPWWGIIPALWLGGGMYFLSFFLSHYLNKAVDSDRRATVLSFRGLACNLSYSVLGLMYMGLIAFLRDELSSEFSAQEASVLEAELFAQTLFWQPIYFGIVLVLFIGLIMRSPSFAKKIYQ